MVQGKNKQITTILSKVYSHVASPQEKHPEIKKDIIIVVGGAPKYTITALKSALKTHRRKARLMLIHDTKKRFTPAAQEMLIQLFDIIVSCDLKSPTAIQSTLLPYQNELLAITCRNDQYMPLLGNVIPHVPYLKAPTSESLHWASDKVLMRRRLRIHNRTINPVYRVIKDNSKASIKNVIDAVGFPLIVKPSGLAASRLVSICYHREELEAVLKKIFRKIEGVYREHDVGSTPRVLIEQYMDGQMYSIDAYVTKRGKITFCPMVAVKTGRQIGFDDFFGYQQMTPTNLSKESIMTAEYVATEAIHALGLRNTTAHVELMKTEEGWKVIELAARPGGFRNEMYEYSYGFSHTLNDILIRIPEKVFVPRKVRGHSVAMKFFAKEEGYITKLTGIKKIQDLKSFQEIRINKAVGDYCTYAKNGGSSVFNLIMVNKDRSKLLADIRRVEQTIKIETSREGGRASKSSKKNNTPD